MKKIIIYLTIFVLLICSVLAFQIITEKKGLIDNDNYCKIIKQDYFQSYIDYKCVREKNDIIIKWEINDKSLFNILNNCDLIDTNCIDSVANSDDKTKDLKEKTDGILGLFDEFDKYTSDDLIDSYFKDYEKDKVEQDILFTKFAGFPIEKLDGNYEYIGNINPFLNNNGEIVINLKKNSKTGKIKIGLGTVILEFNNSLQEENLSLSLIPGIKSNKKRFIELSKYSLINEAFINLTGKLGNNSPFNLYDNNINEQPEYSRNIVDSGDAQCDSQDGNIIGSNSLQSSTGNAAGVGCSSNSIVTSVWKNLTSQTQLDLNKNFSILISNIGYNLNSVCYTCAGSSVVSAINIRNDTTGYTIVSKSGSCGYSGTYSDSGTLNYLIIYNETDKNFYVYENFDTTSLTTKFNVTGEISLEFYTSAYKFACGTSANYGNAYLTNIRSGLIINNNTIAENFNISETLYPELDFNVGDYDVYNNLLNTEEEFNITEQLDNSINGGLCDCSECSIDEIFCNIPFYFNTSNGGNLEYSNLFINLTLAQLNITFIDETTLKLVNYTNVTSIFNSPERSFNLTTESGYLNVGWSDFGEYIIRYYSNEYPIRQRIYKYSGELNPSLILYMANETNTQDIIFNVVNEYDNVVKGAIITVEKFIPGSGFEPILDYYTNVNGQATASLVPSNELYRYVIYYNDELKWNKSNINGEPVYTTDTNYYFKIITGQNIYELNDLLDSIDSSLTFVNLTSSYGYYQFNFSSTDENEFCLRIRNITNSGIINESCIISDSNNLIYYFNLTTQKTLQAQGLVKYDNVKYVIEQKTNLINPELESPFKQQNFEYVFFGIIILILLFLLFPSYPEISVFLAGLGFAMMIQLDFVYINNSIKSVVVVSIIFLSAIIASLVYQGGKK